MQRPTRYRRLIHRIALYTALGLLATLLGTALAATPAWAQDSRAQSRLEIASVDTSLFPTVGVNLIVTDAQSRPLRELQGLRLRENGVPVADFEVRPFTAGTDLFLIVDANSRIQEAEDESGVTRLQKVKDSILAYAGRFMDLAGRDHVTVIVPGGGGPRVLAEDVTEPAALIDAVRPYDPGRSPQSPVIEMLELALDRAAASKEAGRFQAIVFYSDANGLNESRFEPLIERAQALQTPILVLLLGPGQTPNENAAQVATALTAPTRGFFVPMPTASDSSDLFQVIADNGVQSQVRYASNITRSGSFSLTAALENQSDETTLDLELSPPLPALHNPETVIRRTGTQPDTPIGDLQPTVQPIVVELSWPDGLPRQLRGASLLANGRPQQAPFTGGAELLQFDWLIADLADGRYELTVLVTDTLGLAAQSASQAVTIEVVRPNPLPTPSPTATAQPLQMLREVLPPLPSRAVVEPYLAPAGGALLVLLLATLVFRRWSRQTEPPEPPAPDFWDSEEPLASDSQGAMVQAFLDPLPDAPFAPGAKPIALAGGNITIGRDEGHVQISLHDSSISALHARIRRRDIDYWLYDEGSQHGTLLNYERLGLAPRLLQNGDEIQLGRLRLRFRLQKPLAAPEHVGRQGEEASGP